MNEQYERNGILNNILRVLNVSLEVVLLLITLGFLIGLWQLLS